MRLLRRRRKTVLALTAVALVGGFLIWQLDPQSHGGATGPVKCRRASSTTSARRTRNPAAELSFREVGAELGLVFHHFPGQRSNRLPEDMGGGVALGDYDGDGWTDVFLTGADGPMIADDAPLPGAVSRLFRNEGGRFVDVTTEAGIDLVAQALAAAFCDVDSDADLDLFVTTYGTCRLFLNQGDGRFVDGSGAAGLLDHWDGFWAGIGVADYNLDGAIDLYVCGYVDYQESAAAGLGTSSQYGVAIPALINPSNFDPVPNLLLEGRGDGTFRERAAEAGADDPYGRSLGVLFCDLNGDGWPDLYVANDVSDNALLVNRGDGTFLDYTSQALVGDYRGAMGLAAADFDGDEDLDLFITHWVAQENALYELTRFKDGVEGEPPLPLYLDVADRHRLGFQGLRTVGWATRFIDFDNDGRLDVFVVNGSTIPLADDPARLTPMRSQLFWNAGGKQGFAEIGERAGFEGEHVGRGGATFDFDLDGDEDLLIVRHGDRPALLQNERGNERPCVRLRLRQPSGNRFALGARVIATIGGERRFDVLGTQGSYLSQHAVGELAFGLGDHAQVDSIEVRWPDGTTESAGPFLANSWIEWNRGRTPRVASFPGRDALDRRAPEDVADERTFFELRSQARAAWQAGDSARAVELYRRALVHWTGHGDCLYYLGNSLLSSGAERAALGAFERLVHFEERSSAGWMQIGRIRLPGGDPALDDLDAAETAFERCMAVNPEESGPVTQLGVVAYLKGELDEAAERLERAARQNPRSVEARWFAGRVAYVRGERDRAEHWLREARAALGNASDSASNEGDTKTGGALTAPDAVELSPALLRWRGLAQRTVGIDGEFGGL